MQTPGNDVGACAPRCMPRSCFLRRGPACNRATTQPQAASVTHYPAAPPKFADQIINNPTLGRSSTGTLAIHAVHIPTTTKVLLWGRQQPAYEPNMFAADGTPEVSAVYDFAAGTYVKAPMRAAPFCSGEHADAILPGAPLHGLQQRQTPACIAALRTDPGAQTHACIGTSA